MGTRGVTAVIDRDGILKVAQYGQWDHYPAGQGMTVLNFLSHTPNIQALEDGLKNAEFVSDDYVLFAAKQFVDEDGLMDWEQAEKFSKAYPTLTRDTGANILAIIAGSNSTVPLIDDSEFIKDELFCEGVYTINFATNEFHAYFNDIEATYSLDALPTPEEFLRDMEDIDVTV